ERTVWLFDQHQPGLDQRSPGRQAAAGGEAGGLQAAELQPEADAGAAPGDVVLEVGVEALEAGVQVRRQRDQDKLQVELVEAERLGEAPQPEVGARRLGPLRLRLDLAEKRGGPGVGRSGAWAPFEQRLNLGGRDVEPPKAVVRVG